MSSPADPARWTGMPRLHRPATAILIALALVGGLMVVAVVTAPPALALHQHCGDDLVPFDAATGDGIADGTGSLANGHPDRSSAHRSWSGVGALQDLEAASQRLAIARSILQGSLGVIDATADLIEEIVGEPVSIVLAVGTPLSQVYASTYGGAKIAIVVLKIVGAVMAAIDLGLFIAETSVESSLLYMNRAVGDEDACTGTLMGDTMGMTWVALVQRNLGSSGPPLAMLMAPHRPDLEAAPGEWPLLPATTAADFADWCPNVEVLAVELPTQAAVQPTGGDCVATVQQGFLDAPDLGVQAITNRTIHHLISHGVNVRGAPGLAAQADTALVDGRYRDAFHLYRAAYQAAMGFTS